MTPQGLLLISAVIVGITAIVSKLGLPSKWLPLFTVVAGILAAFLVAKSFNLDIVLVGLLAGFAANGGNENATTTPAAIAGAVSGIFGSDKPADTVQ